MFAHYQNTPKLKLDINTPFGHPVSSFIYNKRGFKLYDLKENVVLVGKSSAKNLKRLIGIPINAKELASLMSANIPAEIKGGILYNDNGKFYFETKRSRFKHGHFRLNSEKFISEVVLISDNDKLQINFTKYSIFGSIKFPKKIVIKTDDSMLSLNFRGLSFKDSINPTHFRLKTGNNARIIRLD